MFWRRLLGSAIAKPYGTKPRAMSGGWADDPRPLVARDRRRPDPEIERLVVVAPADMNCFGGPLARVGQDLYVAAGGEGDPCPDGDSRRRVAHRLITELHRSQPNGFAGRVRCHKTMLARVFERDEGRRLRVRRPIDKVRQCSCLT